MIEAVLALLPVILLIGLGIALRRWALTDARFWAGADKITYYVFFPVLLFSSISTADLGELPLLQGLGIAIVTTTAVAALAWAIARKSGLKSGTKAALVQGTIRPNTYVALALAFSLFGDQAYVAVAFGVLAFVPWVNFLSVIAHASARPTNRHAIKEIARQILINPLLIACLLGWLFNVTNYTLSDVVQQTFSVLGNAALPMGLLTVGAGLDFKVAKKGQQTLLTAALIKLLLLPGLVILALRLTGMDAADGAILLLFAAMPASVSSYALSRNMGGDHKLMAAIITGETLLAAATLPLWLYLRELIL